MSAARNFFSSVRTSFNFLRRGTGYAAAKFTRRFKNWRPGSGSPDGELLFDLETLRERARDLYKNNAVGRGAIKVLTNNVVGRGLKVQSTPDRAFIAESNGLTPEQAEAFFVQYETQVERQFSWWAESTESDHRGQMTFYELTNLALNSVLQSGEAFVTLPMREHHAAPFRLRLGLVEADQVQNPIGLTDSRILRDGIATTPDARPIGYWINRNQEIWPWEFEFVPKFGFKSGRPLILHLFRADRPGQSRGVPFLSPVMGLIKKLDSYTKSELDAAEVASFLSVFIKSDNPDSLDSNGIISKSDPQDEQSLQDEGVDYNLGPAAIMGLQPGESIEVVDPKRPNAGYDAFFTSLLRQIGMALGIPFEVLIRHFTSSYTAARASRIEFEKEVRILREWLVLCLCRPIFLEFLIDEVLSGRIEAPGFFDSLEMMHAYAGSTWSGETMGMMDPQKEVKAAQDRVLFGFSTATAETSAVTGKDYMTNIRILAREKQARKAAGIPDPPSAAPVVSPPEPVEPSEEVEIDAEEAEIDVGGVTEEPVTVEGT